ncbi:AI-2E family transporter [Amorphoplanes digitatis]|uniref:Putative PurR-regulated permease PerM n=1 Tax=Actinoplanes digitatis TaxID=1868 RepID=A0A7W7I044_9ACTN|nr:AI-2E family transporter [Actinoplanes digitatis]MBB4763961.1 putative PurR-regulated permease PerM [Actinoplanes digitatis]
MSVPRTDLVPRWLARLGWSGWLIAGVVLGVAAFIVAVAVVLPYLTPVIFAVILAAVLQPWVGWMRRRRIPPIAAAAIAVTAVPVVVGLLIVVVVIGLRGQGEAWTQTMGSASERLTSALGTDPLTTVADPERRKEILLGLAGSAFTGAVAVIALIFIVLVALYILFFLLIDGPRFGAAIERHASPPAVTVRVMLADAADGLRRYMVGTTFVATMNAVVIGLGAAVLRLPLVFVIALVTFSMAYVPYLGAWLSGIFAVLVALGAGGMGTALWMLAVVLVTQIVLEGLARPLAFGATLDMHPLAVVAVTVAGGILGGVLGVFIAVPLAAIAVSWRRTLRPPLHSDGVMPAP